MSNKSPDIGSHFTPRRRRPFLTGNIGHYDLVKGRKERTQKRKKESAREGAKSRWHIVLNIWNGLLCLYLL